MCIRDRRHRGGGNRRKYRIIDFKRYKDDVPATVVGIEYDPNRTASKNDLFPFLNFFSDSSGV